jgi:hypothetical protein
MKRANPVTRDNIVAELHKTKYDGLMGPIEFAGNGELKQPAIFLYKVAGGQFVLEYPKGSY